MNSGASFKERLRSRLEIWWAYEKWYWAGGVVILYILVSIARAAFGWGVADPDVRVAVVTASLIPEERLTAVKALFEDTAEDRNQDGKTIAEINVYFFPPDSAAFYEQRLTANIRLIGDIERGELLFFLTDDAEAFEADFGVLADAAGECVEKGSVGFKPETLLWEGYELARSCLSRAANDGGALAAYQEKIWAKLKGALE